MHSRARALAHTPMPYLPLCDLQNTKKSYERDTFRKPGGEGWLSEHASSLQSALAAAKDEAKSLREAAIGQLSALEAGRLRERAAKAEKALGVAVGER